MGLFNALFKGSIRKSLAQMDSDTNVIQMAVAMKLLPSFEARYGDDRGMIIAAAVSNRLFAKTSPQHSKEDLALAQNLATDVMKADAEVRYAALMACRARLLCEAEKQSGAEVQVWDTIQWMAKIWNLPSDEASPSVIRNLASTLGEKYVRK